MTKLTRLIAWWQIVCGVLGILFLAAAGFGMVRYSKQWLAMVGPINVVLGTLFFAFAVLAGRRMLRGERWAILASFAVQVLSAVSFAIRGGPHVDIGAGPAINVNLASTHLGANVGLESAFFIGTRLQGPAWEVKLNVLAIIWAVLLARMLASTTPRTTAGVLTNR